MSLIYCFPGSQEKLQDLHLSGCCQCQGFARDFSSEMILVWHQWCSVKIWSLFILNNWFCLLYTISISSRGGHCIRCGSLLLALRSWACRAGYGKMLPSIFLIWEKSQELFWPFHWCLLHSELNILEVERPFSELITALLQTFRKEEEKHQTFPALHSPDERNPWKLQRVMFPGRARWGFVGFSIERVCCAGHTEK